MKKFFIYTAIVFLLNITLIFNIYANNNTSNINNNTELNLGESIFKITGFLEDFKEDRYITFDKYKTITGIAKEGSKIKIINNVLVNDKCFNFQEYEFIVGASGVFSKDINLEIGSNNIEISGIINKNIESKKYLIKRLRQDIKQEMECNIIIPIDRLNYQTK